MSDPTRGGDLGDPTVRTSLQQVLAEQANAAIAKGADPKAVTARLGQMIAHVRANPDLDAQGMAAIGKGADPAAVTGRVWQLAQANGPHGGGSSWGGPEDTTYGDNSTVKGGADLAMLNGIPFGLKAKALGDALIQGAKDAVHGQPTHIGATYDTNIEALQHANQQYINQHGIKGRLAEIAGGAIPAVATLGGSAEASAAPKALSLGSKLLRAAGIGAGTGAVYGASNAHGGPDAYAREIGGGAVGGAILGPVAERLVAGIGGAGKALGVPELVSKGASKVADLIPNDEQGIVLPAIRSGANRIAQATGTAGRANAEIGNAAEADEAAGATRTPKPGVPTLAVDRGGPSVEGLAETIANSPGPARSLITRTIEGRVQQMPNAVQEAIHEGTGVEPASGLDPLRARIAERKRVADQLFGMAEQATKGQVVKSPTLDRIMESPIGEQASKWADLQMANRGQAVAEATPPAPRPEGFSPDQWAMVLHKVGGSTTEGNGAGLPSPEKLHYMKRFLANAARLGLRDGQGGKIAAEAQGALNQWQAIRGELPPIWRAADEAYAEHSRLIDLMDQGRNVFRTGVNPAGRATKAVQNDLGAVNARFAAASPAGQEAGRQGVGIAMQEQARKLGATVKSPGRLFGGPNADAASLGFKTPEEAQSFQDVIKGWDDIAAQRERLLGNSRTGVRKELAEARKPTDLTAAGHAMRGNFGSAIARVVKGGAKDVQLGRQQAVDEEIAKRLMSSDPTALQTALDAARLRAKSGKTVSLLAPVLGTGAESSNPAWLTDALGVTNGGH